MSRHQEAVESSGAITRQVTQDLLDGVPDHDRASLEIILKDFAEECQRRLVTRRPSPDLYLGEESQQSLSVTELDAWMSWYTTESAHEDARSIITKRCSKTNPGSAPVSDLNDRRQSSHIRKVPASDTANDSPCENGSKSATSWYHIIDATNKHHADTSWFEDEEESSEELQCSNGPEDNDREHLTSWYEDDTEHLPESMDQLCHKELETRSSTP